MSYLGIRGTNWGPAYKLGSSQVGIGPGPPTQRCGSQAPRRRPRLISNTLSHHLGINGGIILDTRFLRQIEIMKIKYVLYFTHHKTQLIAIFEGVGFEDADSLLRAKVVAKI